MRRLRWAILLLCVAVSCNDLLPARVDVSTSTDDLVAFVDVATTDDPPSSQPVEPSTSSQEGPDSVVRPAFAALPTHPSSRCYFSLRAFLSALSDYPFEESDAR